MFWVSSKRSICESVRNAMGIAIEEGYRSIAFPLIGAGTGGGNAERVIALMKKELKRIEFDGEVRIVIYKKAIAQDAAEHG